MEHAVMTAVSVESAALDQRKVKKLARIKDLLTARIGLQQERRDAMHEFAERIKELDVELAQLAAQDDAQFVFGY